MRYYASDGSGRSVPGWLMKPCLVAAYPFILGAAFCSEVWWGIWHGWLQMKIEHGAFVHYWRGEK